MRRGTFYLLLFVLLLLALCGHRQRLWIFGDRNHHDCGRTRHNCNHIGRTPTTHA